MFDTPAVVPSTLVNDQSQMDRTAAWLAANCGSRLAALDAYLLWGDDPDNITCQGDAGRLLSGEIITDPADPAYNGYLLPIMFADMADGKVHAQVSQR